MLEQQFFKTTVNRCYFWLTLKPLFKFHRDFSKIILGSNTLRVTMSCQYSWDAREAGSPFLRSWRIALVRFADEALEIVQFWGSFKSILLICCNICIQKEFIFSIHNDAHKSFGRPNQIHPKLITLRQNRPRIVPTSYYYSISS